MTNTTFRSRLAATVALLGLSGLMPCAAEAGPLSDLLWGGSGSEDHYYPIGREYVRANSSPANPVTAYAVPATGAAPAPGVPVTSAPSALYAAPSSTTNYYAPAPTSTSAYGAQTNTSAYVPQRNTVLSPAVPAGAAAGPTVMYRLTSPVVTAPVAAAPIGGVAPAGALLPAVPYSAGYAPLTTGLPAGTMPTTVNYAAAANLATCNTCAVPAPSYRTVWYRIPVTNYRPVTATDPCTGCPTTVMRPCTTYAWQARRVPDERPQSWFSRLFCCFRKRPAPPATAIPPVTVTTNCAPTATYGCPPVAAPVTTPPYYTAPGATVAPSTAPANSMPSYVPPGVYPGAGGGSAPLTEPADYPPTLNPTTPPPASGAPAPLREGSAYPPAEDESRPMSGGEGEANDEQDSSSGSANGQTSNSSSMILGPATGASHDPRLTPQPVPDPDAMLNTQKRFDPPRLLNPRDRSAARTAPRAGAFVQISWPEVKTVSAEVPDSARETQRASAPRDSRATAPRPQRTPTPRVDDGGWHSMSR